MTIKEIKEQQKNGIKEVRLWKTRIGQQNLKLINVEDKYESYFPEGNEDRPKIKFEGHKWMTIVQDRGRVSFVVGSGIFYIDELGRLREIELTFLDLPMALIEAEIK